MAEISNLSLFVTASLVLIVTPGPAVFYVMARGMDQGWKAGLVSALGIEVGTLIHVGAATLGVSAILLASPLAFDLVKYLSVAYLIYLGIRKLTVRDLSVQTKRQKHERLATVFSQGVLVELLNPQTAIFFLAFLPQFVGPAQGSVPLQFLTLGILFVMMAIVTEGTYALLAGTLGHWLKGNPRLLHAQHWFAGMVYIGLGLMAALASYGEMVGNASI
jgi:threonine/homoserine/homoserine lactone efflux protein